MPMKTNRRGFLAGTLVGGAGAALPGCAAPPAVAARAGILQSQLREARRSPETASAQAAAFLVAGDHRDARAAPPGQQLPLPRPLEGRRGGHLGRQQFPAALALSDSREPAAALLHRQGRARFGALLEEVYVHESNYKLQSLALWVPLATIEFAILDMLGRIANKSMGQLVSDIHNPNVAVYRANGERDVSAEAVMANLKRQVEESQAKALKIKIGGRMSHVEYPAGRSEKLIPMVRKEFGDQMVCYADSNGSYDVAEGIKFGKLLEEYKYAFYEEPVPFDWYEETKAVKDAREHSGRRRRTGGEHARLPLAHRQRRARYRPARRVLLRRIHPLDESGAHGRRHGESAHAAHFRRAGLSLHDPFRLRDSERGPVPRVQRPRRRRCRSSARLRR